MKLKPFNLKIGMRLLAAGLMLAIGSNPILSFIVAGICMTFPSWNIVAGILATGAGGEDDATKALIAQIKKSTEEMMAAKGFATKEQIDAVIAERLQVIKDFPTDALKALLDADKGAMAVIKKQGEEITAMKEANKGPKGKDGLKGVLKGFKDKVKAVFEAGDEGGKQITIGIKAAAIMTTGNTVTGHEDLPDDLIESFTEAEFVRKRFPREYVYDLANVTTVAEVEKYIVWLEEGDAQGAFAVVAEGGLKPLMSQDLFRNHSTVRKAAGKYVVTEEFTKFWKKAYTIIRDLLNEKVLRDKAAILTTDLLADAAPYTGSALDGKYPIVTDFHAIAAVAAQIESIEFAPDMLILNPQDKWRIGMSQDAEGRFYMPNVPIVDPSGNVRLLGFIVRTSNKVTVGNFLLGESGLWKIVQEGFTIRIGHGITVTGGTSNGGGNVTDVQSDMDHNRIRVIVEQYFHNYLATNNEGSFVYANFNTVKAALKAPSGS